MVSAFLRFSLNKGDAAVSESNMLNLILIPMVFDFYLGNFHLQL